MEQKFVRMFNHHEIHLIACAVTKNPIVNSLLLTTEFDGYFSEPNQFWHRDSRHERALLKIYKRYPEKHSTCNDLIQTLKIPMPFLGNNYSDGWGELQFLIKRPVAIKLARHRSFDTKVNRWVPEIRLIQPKKDLGNHVYLSLRFYHQDFLPPIPGDWHFEPLYVTVANEDFYRVDVMWEKEEITITSTSLDATSLEIPELLNG